MNKLLFGAVLLLALQASDCATAGSTQDSQVTKEKRAADAQAFGSPTPAPSIVVRPTPLLVSPLNAHNGKWVRNHLGLSDGWTSGEIKREDAEQADYERRLKAWEDSEKGRKRQ